MPEMLVCYANGVFQHEPTASEIDSVINKPDALIWLDIRDPEPHDIDMLRKEFKFHELSLEDVVREQQRPKVESYDGYYFIVFYAAQYDETNKEISTQALHLFVGKKYIVSVHKGEFRQVKETISRWRTPDSPLGNSIGALLYALLDAIVDDYFPVIDGVADQIEDLEDSIFTHFEEDAIQTVFGLKRQLLLLRRAIAPERDVLNILLRREVSVFKNEDIVYLQDVYDHTVRVTDSIDTYRDLLSSALDSYLSLQSNQLNQVVKALTVTSIVLMSVTLVAGVYGMNFDYMPELHWRYGYPYALGLMVFITVALVAFFRNRKWL